LQKFWLRLLPRADGQDPPGAIPVEDDLIDAFYSVHCDQPEAGRRFLKSAEVHTALTNSRRPLARLEIYRGWLKLEVSSEAVRSLTPEDLESTLELLLPVISVYEGQGAPLTAVITVSEEICPFCRGILDAKRDSVVSCAECGTRLHQSCWKENGQCTTWGCKSVKSIGVER